jgi:diacylglycerol kinase family enzyme
MHWSATESIVIDSDPLADVEGDGEPLGETPVEIEVVPNAAQVIVPERAPDSVSVAGPGRIERQ